MTKFPFVGERSFRFMSMTDDDMNDVTDTVRNPTSPPLPNHRPGGRSPSRRGTRTSSPVLPRRSSPLASTTGAGRSRSSGKSRYSRQPRSVRESFSQPHYLSLATVNMKSKYRAEKKSLHILLSSTQAGSGRKVKQEQEEISRNHVPRLFLGSVELKWHFAKEIDAATAMIQNYSSNDF